MAAAAIELHMEVVWHLLGGYLAYTYSSFPPKLLNLHTYDELMCFVVVFVHAVTSTASRVRQQR